MGLDLEAVQWHRASCLVACEDLLSDLLTVLTDDFDRPNDIVVELFELFRRHPPLGVMDSADLLDSVALDE